MGGLQKEFFHMIVEAVFDPGKYPNLLLGFVCCTSSYKIIYAAGGIRTRQFFLATELPRIERPENQANDFEKVYRSASVVEIPPVTRASRKSLRP